MPRIITRLQEYDADHWRYWILRDPKDADILIHKSSFGIDMDAAAVKSLLDRVLYLHEEV